ncbi:hypothetical protein OF83DRAFT_581443 [Amylostereum chailletii]|nr:hypothetical protein OF83DRAFT_581443 [Amylostereum chailletii]
MVNVNVRMSAFHQPGNLADAVDAFIADPHGRRPREFMYRAKISTLHLGYRRTWVIRSIIGNHTASAERFKCDEYGGGTISVEEYYLRSAYTFPRPSCFILMTSPRVQPQTQSPGSPARQCRRPRQGDISPRRALHHRTRRTSFRKTVLAGNFPHATSRQSTPRSQCPPYRPARSTKTRTGPFHKSPGRVWCDRLVPNDGCPCPRASRS